MPTKATGLIGYIAEEVVYQWLMQKYQGPTYQVIRQVMPANCPRRGGGYLDFGVARGEEMVEVYEAKGQDYICDSSFKLNKALLHMWQTQGTVQEFVCQNGPQFKGTAATKGYLVLLAPPNADGIEVIGAANIKSVLLFHDLWVEINSREMDTTIVQDIMRDIPEDVRKVMSILKNPTQGRRLLDKFLKLRDG